MTDKMVALVIKSNYLPYSEVFIYEEMRRFKQFDIHWLISVYNDTRYFPEPKNFTVHPWSYEHGSKSDLLEILKKISPDIIYFQFGFAAHFFFEKVDRKMNVPVVVSLRGADVSVFVKISEYDYGALSEYVDLFLVRSNEMAIRVKTLGVPEEKIIVHYTGIDITKFNFTDVSNNPLNKCICISRLVGKKGIDDIVKAIGLVKKELDPGFMLDIYGTGPLRHQLIELIQELNVGDFIRLNKSISHEELSIKLKAYSFMIQASKTDERGDMEGIPNSLKEAMAIGLRIITTDHAGIPELLKKPEWAWIVPEGDIESLSKAILAFSTSQNYSISDFKERRSFIESDFNIDKQVEDLETMFNQLTTQYEHHRK